MDGCIALRAARRSRYIGPSATDKTRRNLKTAGKRGTDRKCSHTTINDGALGYASLDFTSAADSEVTYTYVRIRVRRAYAGLIALRSSARLNVDIHPYIFRFFR